MVRIDKEIYKDSNGNIYMWDSYSNDSSYYFGCNCSIFEKGRGNFKNLNFTIPTNDEKSWLLYCININTFIEFSEFLTLKTKIYELW